MMKQYRRIKSQLPPDTILFFRLGDFYEMFYEDAKAASEILDIALTRRNNVPMCGIPYHAAELYLAKLVRAGRKVAVCDQLEDASVAKGIVRRDVTAIVTPGTVTLETVLESKQNSYLAAVCEAVGMFGFALLDLSTGEFQVEETDSADVLKDNLARFAPNECIVPVEQRGTETLGVALAECRGATVTECDDWIFEYEAARDVILRHFGLNSLEGFGCEGRPALAAAAGATLYYVKENLKRNISHVRSLHVRNPSDFLVLDEGTCMNLDIVPVRRAPGQSDATSLLGVLDSTRTGMGGRLMREWMLRPLADGRAIAARHDVVEALCGDRPLLQELRERLGSIRDMQRIIARLGGSGGSARDLRSLAQSLASLPEIRALVARCSSERMREMHECIVLLPDLVELVGKAIVDEPPATTRDGGIVRQGYNTDLDELRDAASEGRQWLAEFQNSERERTGIKNLKVRHNKVFGYYIEVSKGQLASVPEEYIRKQTVANAERFITPEIKEYERRILGAQERSIALEYGVFSQIRDEAVRHTDAIQRGAGAIAELDALASFAERALALRYVRPVLTEGSRLEIREGRHPIVEQMPGAERFVPNDTVVDCEDDQLLMITGPNMAGKSTYIRQVALIVVMAQAGSFVPATAASMCVVDRVFTRVGASDDLARGRSTFMVEMEETANILNNATARSLIVLDEIGRGTSTFDGISIAWAVAEYLHNNPRVRAKTLFATHYHELTDLAVTMQGVKNYNVLVRERGDKVVFLRKIMPGPADKSYGIQVARLAGLPPEVIDRAKEILLNLEEGEFLEAGQPKIATHRSRKARKDRSQMTLVLGEDSP
jgi:DNA mismatch repair protein MutS